MNRVWEQRRRNARLWREVRRGVGVLKGTPHAVVHLPGGLAMISYERYHQLRQRTYWPR